MAELAKCARCGSEDGPTLDTVEFHGRRHDGTHVVKRGAVIAICEDCYDGTPCPWGWTPEEAIAAWNEQQAQREESEGDWLGLKHDRVHRNPPGKGRAARTVRGKRGDEG